MHWVDVNRGQATVQWGKGRRETMPLTQGPSGFLQAVSVSGKIFRTEVPNLVLVPKGGYGPDRVLKRPAAFKRPAAIYLSSEEEVDEDEEEKEEEEPENDEEEPEKDEEEPENTEEHQDDEKADGDEGEEKQEQEEEMEEEEEGEEEERQELEEAEVQEEEGEEEEYQNEEDEEEYQNEEDEEEEEEDDQKEEDKAKEDEAEKGQEKEKGNGSSSSGKDGKDPPFPEDGKPLHFLGGVIYTDTKGRKFRVKVSKSDRKDKAFSFKVQDKGSAWAQSLEHIRRGSK